MNPDNLGNAVATAAVASPWWLPYLQEASQVASAVLPFLGALWLVVQITVKISDWRARRKSEAE